MEDQRAIVICPVEFNLSGSQVTTNFKGVAVNKTCWITKASESCS